MLGSIYDKIVDVRNYLYDKGVFDTFDLGARTISIGNITAGGTGKTPLVAFVASLLAERGEKVCILTRGYGREDAANRVLVSNGTNVLAGVRQSGDEPFELANKLLGKAIVIADADRVAAAEWARRKIGVTVFVLDDGFQHRKVKRDLDIVCIDATEPFGGGLMLPAGRLREPLPNLERADLVVITRADQVNSISDLRSDISKWNEDAAIFASRNKIKRMIELSEFHAITSGTLRKEVGDTSALADQKAFAFCGIGNPKNFFSQLWQDHFEIPANKVFRDHHIYTQADIAEIEALARQAGAEIILTTAKDAVKLSDLKFEIPCYVVEIDVKLDDDDAFRSLL